MSNKDDEQEPDYSFWFWFLLLFLFGYWCLNIREPNVYVAKPDRSSYENILLPLPGRDTDLTRDSIAGAGKPLRELRAYKTNRRQEGRQIKVV